MPELRIGNYKLYTEIPVLLLFYSFMVSDAVNNNFIIYRTCYVTLGYNESDCAKLGSQKDNATAELEKIVEPYANVIMMTSSLSTQILPALLTLFIGPWSDKNGRKPVLISTITGFTIAGVVQTVISLLPNISPWYTIMAALPVVLSGGFASFLMVVLCYITDVTSETDRGLRIGMFEVGMALGMLPGTLSSSYLFNAAGYTGVFGLSMLCAFLALLYVIFLTPETILASQLQANTSIFSLSNIEEMIRMTFRRRENHKRLILLLTISLLVIYMLAMSADMSVIFLYFRQKFHWTLQKYTLYTSARATSWIVGTFVGVYLLHKLCRTPESVLLIIGFAVLVASLTIQGLATKDWHIYVAGGIRCIAGVVSPMSRSLISKMLSPDEVGKVFSFTVTVESLVMMIGSPAYTFIYNKTISTLPGAFNFVTAGLYSLDFILIIVVLIVQRVRVNQYRTLEINNEE